jgi:hypothetical protein
MAVKALTPEVVDVPLSGRWIITVKVTDDDGYRADVAPTITVTLPNGTTSSVTPEAVRSGVYRGVYVPTGSVGRYVARATALGYGVVDFVAYVAGTTLDAAMPVVQDVRDYAGTLSQTDDQIQSALDAEAAAQRNRCRVSAVYPADLREALIRRAVVNLDKRNQRNTQLPEDGGPRFTPSNDPEVRRLEGPYRKAVVA